MAELQLFFENSLVFAAIFTPVLLGLVQVIKNFGLDSKWAPVASVVLGAVAGYFFGSYDVLSYNILLGVITGLSASGLYSGAKAVRS